MSQDTPRQSAKSSTLEGWIAREQRETPAVFARRSAIDLGTADLPVERYLSREFHELELTRMWSRVWQMACHETDIPEVGDYTTYEIGQRSFVLVRIAPDAIKAYPNACLHRGTQLVEGTGHGPAFRCRFHGWTWNLEGTLRHLPEEWDFPQAEKSSLCLPEVAVATWGGFVFLNPDREAEPFERYMGELPQHFASAPLEDRAVAAHVARVMPANWKVAMEAFLESYHVFPTHPQSVPIAEYAESCYDTYPQSPNISRLVTISVAPATAETRAMSDQQFGEYVTRMTAREPVQVPAGRTYRNALAEQRREAVGKVQGRSVDHLTDVEMLDAIEYFLFPNFLPWHGFGLPIAYRFRPNGDRHDSSIMEVYLLTPRDLSKSAPRAAPISWLRDDQPFAEHPQLGRLGAIFDQDYENIRGVQRGLHSTVRRGVMLGRYQESRIRHYHRRIDDFLQS